MEARKVKVKVQLMDLGGPGAGLSGKLKTEHVGAPAAISGTFVAGDFEITVREQGEEARIDVISRTATAWTDELKSEMKDAVEPYVLALCLRTGVALEIEWSSAAFVAADGQRQVWAYQGFRVVQARDPIQSLGTYSADALLIDQHRELRAALEQYAGSTLLAVDQPGASMALAYLAVEGLVMAVLGAPRGA